MKSIELKVFKVFDANDARREQWSFFSKGVGSSGSLCTAVPARFQSEFDDSKGLMKCANEQRVWWNQKKSREFALITFFD